MMNGFNVFMEKHIVPFAVKLNEQRHVAAIRDAFMYTFPITMAASLVILINNLVFSKTPNCQIKCNTFDLFLVIGLVNRSLAELPLPIDS